jgi:DNA-binding transcriptional LysR family regulator
VSSLVRGPGERSQWLDVEFRHLAALAAVAEQGSFGKAAASLGYVQSAVSQQIAFLERLVGSRLVDRTRGPRPVSLTRAGEVMLDHAEDILAQLQAAQTEFDALTRATNVSLRVGLLDSVTVELMPEVLPRVRDQWPDLCISTFEYDPDDLVGLVETGALDVAFGVLPLPDGPFAMCELLSEPYVLVVPADSPLAGRGRLESLDELGAGDHIGAGRPAKVEAFVAGGAGVAILPRLAVDGDHPGTAIVGLGELVPPRRIALFWHRDHERPDMVAAFVRLTADVCGERGA